MKNKTPNTIKFEEQITDTNFAQTQTYSSIVKTNKSTNGDSLRQMKEEGFCHIEASDFALTKKQLKSFSEVQDHFDILPLDTYDRSANRYRQLARYVFLPYANILIPNPKEDLVYKQDALFNEEAKGIERNFEALPQSICDSTFLRDLIMHDFFNSPMSDDMLFKPLQVGVHFIRLKATENSPGVAVPNCLHKDGEPFTWIHLISRTDVTGGENVITNNNQTQTLCETTLNTPLDSIGIVDDQVWHMVKPVQVKDTATVGIRDVILIDFTPMVAVPSEPPTHP